MSNVDTFVKEFIRHLLSATANASLYGMRHPQVSRLAEQAYESLQKALGDRPEFSLVVIENEMVIEGHPQEFSLFLNRFAEILSSRGIGHIRFIQGITRQEIIDYITSLSRQGSDSVDEIKSSEHLRLGWIEIKGDPEGSDSSGQGQNRCSDNAAGGDHEKIKVPTTTSDIPAAELARFRDIYDTVKQNHKLKINGIVEIVSAFVDVYRQEGKSLFAAAAMRESEDISFTHSTNVSILNIAQASMLGIEGQLLSDIGVAGMLHDIGKMFLPEEIQTKQAPLNMEELELMKSHPARGARYLLETPGVPRLAVINAFEHHLRYDLSGYPSVPKNWQQSLCSHITAISDVYDALRTPRSYREHLNLKQIATIMMDMMGIELHPVLTRNFLSTLSRFARSE